MNTMVRLFIILILFISCNENQSKQNAVNVPDKSLDSLENKAIEKYSTEPMHAIELFKKAANGYRASKNYRKSGQAYLNIAGIYEEKVSDFSKALFFSKESLHDWTMVKDTMQIANLYKYVGYLEGLNNNYSKAKVDIETAIDLYKRLNFDQGLAVSHINMAKIHLLKSNFEEAKKYFTLSKTYWYQQGNKSRVFDNNLVGIKVFQHMNEHKEINRLIQENKAILNDQEIDEYLIGQFNTMIDN